MGLLETLTAEIERVVSASYAVSLKKLHEILIDCDSSVVHAWADASTCQLGPLARSVKDALEKWPYTPQILQRLARARPFRDAFLRQDPSILDALLRKADHSSGVFQTCVILLSTPLPESIPLPSSAQEFFLKSFDKAIESMDEQHVGVAHTLLDGACQDLLGLLPKELFERIEEQAYRLLKEVSARKETEDEERLRILCLGLAGILAPFCKPKSRHIVPAAAAPEDFPFILPQRSNSAEHLGELPRVFSGSATRATMRFTVTLATGILKSQAKVADEDTVRYLKIISNVTTIMPFDARQGCLQRDAQFVQKLIEKLLTAGTHPVIQLQGLAYIALLHEGRPMPEKVVSAYWKALVAARKFPPNYPALAEAVSVSLPCFAAHLEERFVRDVLCSSIQAAIHPKTQVGELQWLLLLTKLLGEIAQDSTAVWRDVLLTLSSDNFQDQLQNLLSFCPAHMPMIDSAGPCRSVALDSARRLGLEVCSLLLRSALMAQADQLGMDARIGLRLLQKQLNLASLQLPPCKHIRPGRQSVPPLSLVQELCTPRSQPDSYEWRKRLAKDLEVKDKNYLELIERTVSEVCRDLEARCEEVEEPLRLEQQKVHELQEEVRKLKKKNEDLTAHADDLENRDIDRLFFMEGLETEKLKTEQALKHGDEVNDDLSRKVETLQRMLQTANQTAEVTLASARQDYDRMDAELRAILAKEETRFEEQVATNDHLKAHITRMETDLNSKGESLAQEQKTNDELRESLSNALQLMEEQKTAKLQAQAEVSDLTEKEMALISQLDVARTTLTEAHKASSDLKAEYESTVASMRGEIESLRHKAEAELRQAEEEASKACRAIESHLQKAKEDNESLNREKEELFAELQERESHITKLQRKIERLSDARGAAEAKSKELETWRSQMMSFMSVPAGGMSSRTVKSRKRPDSTPGPSTPGCHNKRQNLAETSVNIDGGPKEDVDLTESEESKSPEGLSGSQRDCSASPTPKRAKIQRQQPFKPPTLKLTTSATTDNRRRSMRISQSRRASTATRKPLGDISTERGNLSPMRKNVNFGGAPTSSAKSAKQIAQLDGSFDASEFFVGTPITPSGRYQQQADNSEDGDTTVDL